MIKNVIVLVIVLSLSIQALKSQKRFSRITFKDSTKVNGLAKFLDEGREVQFFGDKGTGPVIYSYLNIEKVEMRIKNKSRTFEYIQVINQGKVKLAELLVSGKVNLYEFSYQTEGWSPQLSNNFPSTFSISTPNGPIKISTSSNAGVLSGSIYREFSHKDFCVKRNVEEMARYFKDAATGAGFRKMGAYYFQDCPKISDKIQSGKLPLRKLQEIVIAYNTTCD